MLAEIIIAALVSFDVLLIVGMIRTEVAYKSPAAKRNGASIFNLQRLFRRSPKHTLL
jgi:hypothetical protein